MEGTLLNWSVEMFLRFLLQWNGLNGEDRRTWDDNETVNCFSMSF